MQTYWKKCAYCGFLKTNIASNDEGTKFKEGIWVCLEWYRHYLFLKTHSPNYFRGNEPKGVSK